MDIDIFMLKDNLRQRYDMEIEDFTRFCFMSKPQAYCLKVAFKECNIHELLSYKAKFDPLTQEAASQAAPSAKAEFANTNNKPSTVSPPSSNMQSTRCLNIIRLAITFLLAVLGRSRISSVLYHFPTMEKVIIFIHLHSLSIPHHTLITY